MPSPGASPLAREAIMWTGAHVAGAEGAAVVWAAPISGRIRISVDAIMESMLRGRKRSLPRDLD